MEFADAHIHLLELNQDNAYYDIKDADLLFSCCSEYGQWMSQHYTRDDHVKRFYGIHPWHADQWNKGMERELRFILERDPAGHVGEIGLDNKHDNMDMQLHAFEEQVKIASDLKRCINIHNLGCDGDIIRILKKQGRSCRSIILHCFKGADTKQFSGLDCYFSLNPRILEKSPDNLRDIVTKIPADRILIESDAPFIADGFTTMHAFISSLSEIVGTRPEEFAALTLENARRAIGD